MCNNCGHQESCHVQADGNADLTAIVERLREMEYAIDGGNTACENVPASAIRDWFRYVWTGEGFVDVR
jgi:hypothetical protein